MGAIVSFIPEKLAVLLMSEFLPVTCICTEYIVFLKVTRMMLEEAEEGFRRDCSTKRQQMSKLHSILADQREWKTFTSWKAVEACSFP